MFQSFEMPPKEKVLTFPTEDRDTRSFIDTLEGRQIGIFLLLANSIG